jgi:EAL domain-containing protein (putative c-di-GMP-specific phosphodiesterase class I)
LDQTLAEQVEALLRKHGVAPKRLEFEITESTLMADPERTLEVAQAITGLGVGLAIDDFGTGYSSLAYLKRLPLAALKIDRTFVRDMLDDEQDLLIVRSTVQLAQGLGLEVVAEGVEDGRTLEHLRTLGCDRAQGYHIARPIGAVELEAWLANTPYASSASTAIAD